MNIIDLLQKIKKREKLQMPHKQEVEIKVCVDEEVFLRIKSKIKHEAEYTGQKKQNDVYFTPQNRNFMDEKYPYEWLSIRKRGEASILNYKHFYPEGAEKHSHCDEYEVHIDDSDALHNIFSSIGINNLITVKKTRETYILENKYEVAFDIVEQLGHFIEIELIESCSDAIDGKKLILNLLTNWGVSEQNIDHRGYPFLLYEKKNANASVSDIS